MGILFGKSKKPVSRVSQQDKAVLQLKQQRDRLKLYQKRIENSLESDKLLAKKLLNQGKKDRAKLILKKKRYQEQLLLRTDGQLENLEKLTHDLEFAQVELQVLDGLKVGNEALKKVNDILNIDEIEKILDETKEAVDKQKEIDELLSGQLTEEDNEAIENEFANLIADQLPSIPNEEVQISQDELVDELPEVPSEELSPKKEKEKKLEKVALEA